ncbi:MAG: glycine cleavage system aminomethyltransferase GcvT, partial [Gammaproteobacteria bacterium]|nr:glycine cleavage system aminomethyltransferase GcvT [Gammaproteobacteria bacterium]
MSSDHSPAPKLEQTALFALHAELGAKLVEFAGYAMPLQYAPGIVQEHIHTREHAGLFDVSHMGQIAVRGPPAALEKLVPSDITGLAEFQQRYTVLTNASGGIIDDLMVTRVPGGLFVVVNA